MGKDFIYWLKNKIENKYYLGKRRRYYEQCGVASFDGLYAGLE